MKEPIRLLKSSPSELSSSPLHLSSLQEKACEQQTSFDLTPYDLASAIEVVSRLLAEQARDVGRGEVLSDGFSDESSIGQAPAESRREISLNKSSISKIYSTI